MHRKELTKIIRHHFDAINKLSHKVVDRFDEEEIHDLRVEIKKLRAFLKLISVEGVDDNKLKFSGRLKEFNGCIGNIRDLQLLKYVIVELLPDKDVKVVFANLQRLESYSKEFKIQAINLVRGQFDFLSDRDFVLEKLPDKLAGNSIRKFVRRRSKKVVNLLLMSQTEDDNLHKLRIGLKCIRNNWPYIKKYAYLLPPVINTRGKLEDLTGILGLFCDQCTALQYLQPPYVGLPGTDCCLALETVQDRLAEKRDKYKSEFFTAINEFRKTEIPFPISKFD